MKNFYYLIVIIFISLIANTGFSKETSKDKWQKNVPLEAIELTRKARLKGGALKRVDDAIIDFKAAINLKKDYYWATLNLAIAYTLSSGDHSREAEKIFLKAVAIAEKHNIKDPMLFDTFGQYYFKHEKYAKAMEQFYRALKIDKKYVKSFNNLGVAYEKIGKKNKALLNYEKAMNLGFPIAKDNYGRLFAKIEDKKNFLSLPQTYFIDRRKGDPESLPPTYFDNLGRPGMAKEK